MKKIILVIVTSYFFAALVTQACTEEEFKALDKEITNIQKNDLAEKTTQLDNYLQQIRAKKNLSDKELFEYRKNILNHPKAKKLHEKERKITAVDMLRVVYGNDCKTLKEWTDESMESAQKQWAIVFEELDKELNKNTEK